MHMGDFASKMATSVTEGCQVGVPARLFDIPGAPDADMWSVATFGDGWDSARCSGLDLKVLRDGLFCRVRWEIDNRVDRVGVLHCMMCVLTITLHLVLDTWITDAVILNPSQAQISPGVVRKVTLQLVNLKTSYTKYPIKSIPALIVQITEDQPSQQPQKMKALIL